MAIQEKKTENVLIVDDVVANLVVLTDIIKKAGYIALLSLTRRVLEACIDVLGFEAPERM